MRTGKRIGQKIIARLRRTRAGSPSRKSVGIPQGQKGRCRALFMRSTCARQKPPSRIAPCARPNLECKSVMPRREQRRLITDRQRRGRLATAMIKAALRRSQHSSRHGEEMQRAVCLNCSSISSASHRARRHHALMRHDLPRIFQTAQQRPLHPFPDVWMLARWVSPEALEVASLRYGQQP